MKRFKLNTIRPDGKLFKQYVTATSKEEAARMTDKVIVGIYEVNSVGAIIG